jgi:photosystem II stability/assembly factor-like uncharacterized protein
MKYRLLQAAAGILFTVSSLGAMEFTTAKQFGETSSYLRDVFFAGEKTGWAAGRAHWDQSKKTYAATILSTTDGGKTWTVQEAGGEADLNGVFFPEAMKGWAAGDDGVVMRTTNGGTSWDRRTMDAEYDFAGVVFSDASNGWITGTKPVHYDWLGDADDWQAAVWHTTNGGQTWNKQTLPENASILKRIDFVDANRGWAAGARSTEGLYPGDKAHRAMVYATTDGGKTWTERFNHDLEITLCALDFLDAKEGWAAGFYGRSDLEGGSVFHTTDGGKTWDRINEGGFMKNFWDVHFLDKNRGFLVGTYYGAAAGPPIVRTTDGGKTWETLTIQRHDGEGLYGVAVFENRVVAVGDHDFLAESDKPWAAAPVAWEEQLFTQRYLNVHYRFEDVFFTDKLRGWAAGSRTFLPDVWGQVIFSTSDGGNTWAKQYELSPPLEKSTLFSYFRLDKVQFLNSRLGWAVGSTENFSGPAGWIRRGAIMHTTDGGSNWAEQGLELNAYELFSVQFFDSLSGWAINNGTPGIKMAHTTDGGANWSWIDTGIGGPLAIGFLNVMGDLCFTDPEYGWGTGGLGKVVQTTDGGKTWEDKSFAGNSAYRHCFALQFLDRQNGWVAGEGLFRTTDGGGTWNEATLDHIQDYRDIQFTSALCGWTVGDGGSILGTADGGGTWKGQTGDLASASDLKGLLMVNDSTGWAAGDEGTILKLAARLKTGVRDDGAHAPGGFALHPNFPNPFNPVTSISYELARPCRVSLKIVDLGGRTIALLDRGLETAGTHSVSWNASGLSSGVYVAVMEAKDAGSGSQVLFRESRKIVLQK